MKILEREKNNILREFNALLLENDSKAPADYIRNMYQEYQLEEKQLKAAGQQAWMTAAKQQLESSKAKITAVLESLINSTKEEGASFDQAKGLKVVAVLHELLQNNEVNLTNIFKFMMKDPKNVESMLGFVNFITFSLPGLLFNPACMVGFITLTAAPIMLSMFAAYKSEKGDNQKINQAISEICKNKNALAPLGILANFLNYKVAQDSNDKELKEIIKDAVVGKNLGENDAVKEIIKSLSSEEADGSNSEVAGEGSSSRPGQSR